MAYMDDDFDEFDDSDEEYVDEIDIDEPPGNMPVNDAVQAMRATQMTDAGFNVPAMDEDDFDDAEDMEGEMPETPAQKPQGIIDPKAQKCLDEVRKVSYGSGCDFDKLATDLFAFLGFKNFEHLDRGGYRFCLSNLIGARWKSGLSKYLNNGEVPTQAPYLGVALNNGHIAESADATGDDYSPERLEITLCLLSGYYAGTRAKFEGTSVEDFADFCAKHCKKDISVSQDVVAHAKAKDYAWFGAQLKGTTKEAPVEYSDPIFDVVKRETLDILLKFYDYLLDNQFEGILGKFNGKWNFYKRVDAQIVPAGDVFVETAANNMANLNAIKTSNALGLTAPDVSNKPNYAALASAWATAYRKGTPCLYIPQLHISLLSGYTSENKVSLKLKDHKDDVSSMLTTMFNTVAKMFSDFKPLDRQTVADVLRKTILNVLILQRYKQGMIFSFAYSMGIDELSGDRGVFKCAETDASFFLSKGVLLAKPKNVASSDQGNILMSAQFCTNKDAYNKDINFAYKAVLDMQKRGKVSSFSSILLGTTLANEPVTVNLDIDNCFCLPIFADSGSGKGVLTLATLGTAIATGHPFIYLDSKPDMAALFWGYEHELQQQGKDVKFLAVDVFKANPPDETAQYIPDRIRNNYGRNKDKMKSFLSSVGLTTALNDDLIKGALWSKFSQLVLMLDSSDYSGKRLVAVLDETNKVMSTFSAMSNNVTGWGSAILNLNTIIKDKKTSDEDKNAARSKRALLRRLACSLGFSTTLTGDQKYAVYSYDGKTAERRSELDKRIGSYLTTSGRIRKSLTLMIIGQIISEMKPIFPWTQTILDGNKNLCGFTTPVVGKGNIGFVPNAESQLNGGSIATGQFFVKSSVPKDGQPPYSLCKTYLTLNENDYYTPAKYNKVELRKYTGMPANGKSDAWVVENYGTADKPNEAVGFIGYIKLLAQTNGLSEDQLYATMNEGYTRAMQQLEKHGILKHFGYTCVEDWLYDLDPESFLDVGILLDNEGDYFAQIADMNSTDDMASDSQADDDAMSSMQNAFSAGTGVVEGAYDAPSSGEPVVNLFDESPAGASTENILAPIVEGTTQEGVSPAQEESVTPEPTFSQPTSAEPTSEPAYTRPEPTPEPVYANSEPAYTNPEPARQEFTANQFGNSSMFSSAQTTEMPPTPVVSPIPEQGTMSDKVARRLKTSYGDLDPDLSTHYASAYKNESSVDKVDCGTGAENVFAVYRDTSKPTNFKLLRRELTDRFLKSLSGAYGNLGMINTFEEQNGVLYFNKQAFDPDLSGLEYLEPNLLRKAVEGQMAYFFNFAALKRFKNLAEIKIESQNIIDCYFWNDLGFTCENASRKAPKIWRSLRVFSLGGVDLLARWTADSETASTRDLESRQAAEYERRERGRSFGGALAAALGIPASSADEHPVMQAFGNSKPIRAVRKGALFGAACWAGWGLLSLANPFLLLGGAFATAAFVKSCVGKKSGVDSARSSYKAKTQGKSDAQEAFDAGYAYGSTPPKGKKK